MPDSTPAPIFTIGHSNRSIGEFVGLLQAHGIGKLVDIRSIPKSRYNPQFHTDALAAALESAGIGYRHEPALGGRRPARKHSINTAWRHDSFRGYADHMQTPEFTEAIAVLLAESSQVRLAVMCAEAVPWRCHRSLVGDALVVRGISVTDIISIASARPHVLTEFAVVDGTSITYPGQQELFDLE